MHQLLGALRQDVEPRAVAGSPRLTDPLLRAHDAAERRIRDLQLGRQADTLLAHLFGVQARLAGEQRQALQHQGLVLGARLRALEHGHRLAGLDHLAFAHRQLGNNAAFQVLDRLLAAVRVDDAGGYRAAVERNETAPAGKHGKEDQDQDIAPPRRPADVGLERREYYPAGAQASEGLWDRCDVLRHVTPAMALPLRAAEAFGFEVTGDRRRWPCWSPT